MEMIVLSNQTLETTIKCSRWWMDWCRCVIVYFEHSFQRTIYCNFRYRREKERMEYINIGNWQEKRKKKIKTESGELVGMWDILDSYLTCFGTSVRKLEKY